MSKDIERDALNEKGIITRKERVVWVGEKHWGRDSKAMHVAEWYHVALLLSIF